MQVIKVRGKGMPLRGADPPRNGTLHVRALVEFPSSLSPQALRLAESLRSSQETVHITAVRRATSRLLRAVALRQPQTC